MGNIIKSVFGIVDAFVLGIINGLFHTDFKPTGYVTLLFMMAVVAVYALFRLIGNLKNGYE